MEPRFLSYVQRTVSKQEKRGNRGWTSVGSLLTETDLKMQLGNGVGRGNRDVNQDTAEMESIKLASHKARL